MADSTARDADRIRYRDDTRADVERLSRELSDELFADDTAVNIQIGLPERVRSIRPPSLPPRSVRGWAAWIGVLVAALAAAAKVLAEGWPW